MDGKQARLYQTLNEGKQLVTFVSCPELEDQTVKLEEQWLSLNKKIDHELHRLQTLLKHLRRYVFLVRLAVLKFCSQLHFPLCSH
jgi:nesprin-2